MAHQLGPKTDEIYTNWQATWQNAVRSEDDLVRFVQTLGCCTINTLQRWPAFPSQEVAMGRADVLGATWFWKDDLHTQQRIFYTRLFAGRPGFISFELLPYFIATNGEVADELIHCGKLPVVTREILHIIDERGPISTRQLKKLLGPEAQRAAAAALIDLERRFIITKTDIAGRDLSSYSYIWDLAERWVPEAFRMADRVKRKAATATILERLQLLGVEASPAFLTRVLRWPQ